MKLVINLKSYFTASVVYSKNFKIILYLFEKIILESENLIKESINKLSQEITVVVIAHRLSTISNSDYVYVLETGKIVEEGSYEELSKNSESSLYTLIQEQGKS